MARCPLTGVQDPRLYFCLDYPGWTVCRMCPAYRWRTLLAILFWLLKKKVGGKS